MMVVEYGVGWDGRIAVMSFIYNARCYFNLKGLRLVGGALGNLGWLGVGYELHRAGQLQLQASLL